MLYPIYTAIKQQLKTIDTENKFAGIEWYNVQYESTIAKTPRIFVEFPEELKFDQITKDSKRAPIKIQLHIVSQAIAGADGAIADSIVEEHENVAKIAKKALCQFTPTYDGVKLTKPLQLYSWKHYHKYKGYMITMLVFTCKKHLIE